MPSRRREHRYFVYIMSSQTRVLYIGVTNDLERRVQQLKDGLGSQFTTKYRVRRLVHYEETSDVRDAISREKELKGWTRARKVALIEGANPDWGDLSAEWPGSSS
jgi:putative endonuclease